MSEILSWDPPVNHADGRIRQSPRPIHPREESVFTVEGDVWRGKVEENDCDLHVEVTGPGAGRDADRIVIEIPAGPEFADARRTVMEALRCRDADCRVDRAVNLRRPVRLRFTGFGFWDAAHWIAEDPRRGNRHGSKQVGTLWEIHPAWRVDR